MSSTAVIRNRVSGLQGQGKYAFALVRPTHRAIKKMHNTRAFGGIRYIHTLLDFGFPVATASRLYGEDAVDVLHRTRQRGWVA
jgi:hypothetical protein